MLRTDRQTCSVQRAMQLTGVSRRAVYNWMARGKVEYIRTAGGGRRIFLDTLLRDGNVTVIDALQGCAIAPTSATPTPPPFRSKYVMAKMGLK